MDSEAQVIMTLSMKKIVESRNRRGGASLHRNLLVAGVLFKARDVLLAQSAIIVTADSLDKSSETDEMECERTVSETETASLSSSSLADVCSSMDCKENVPPCNQPTSVVVPGHPRCDDIQPSTDKTRAVKRLSRDADDDDVTPCKTTRSDTSAERPELRCTEADMCDADDADVSSEVCRQTCSSMSCSYRPAVLPSVVRRSYFDSCPTQNVADPPLVRTLLVVQVV